MPDEEKNEIKETQEIKIGEQPETAAPGIVARAADAGRRAAVKVADTARAAVSAVVGSTIPADRPSITPEQMYQIGRRFAEKLFSDPAVAPKLLESKMVINFKYYDERWGDEEPEVTVDCSGEEMKLFTGPCEIAPVVTMRMHGDTAHRFWKQKVNMMAAITRGEISARGPVPKVMRLLPIIKPGYEYYKQTLEELGFTELLNYPPESV
ncbi:MAG: hypothetical protein AB1546_02965 [bacterium]